MPNLLDYLAFVMLLFSSIFGEVIVFQYKFNLNLPKIGLVIFIVYFFVKYRFDLLNSHFFKKNKLLFLSMCAIFLWSLFTFYKGSPPLKIKAFPFALRYFAFPFLVLAFLMYIRKAKEKVWILLYEFMFFLAFGGIGQIFFGKQILPLLKLSHPNPNIGYIAYSFLYQHNIFGNTMNFFFWMGLFLFLEKKIKLWLFLFSSGLSIFCIFLSTSRGAMFSFSVMLFIVLFTYLKGKQKWFILIFIILALILLMSALNMSPYLSKRLERVYPGIKYLAKYDFHSLSENDLWFKIRWDFSGRRKIWKEGWELFKAHPIYGIGPGFYRFISKVKAHHMHNIFYNILVEQGIVGFFIWLWFFIYTIIIGFKSKHFSVFFVLIILLSQMFGYFFDHSYFYFILTSFTVASVFANAQD